MDVKFASGIKNFNFGFYPYTDVCLALYTQYEESHKTAVIQWRLSRRAFFPQLGTKLEK